MACACKCIEADAHLHVHVWWKCSPTLKAYSALWCDEIGSDTFVEWSKTDLILSAQYHAIASSVEWIRSILTFEVIMYPQVVPQDIRAQGNCLYITYGPTLVGDWQFFTTLSGFVPKGKALCNCLYLTQSLLKSVMLTIYTPESLYLLYMYVTVYLNKQHLYVSLMYHIWIVKRKL